MRDLAYFTRLGLPALLPRRLRRHGRGLRAPRDARGRARGRVAVALVGMLEVMLVTQARRRPHPAASRRRSGARSSSPPTSCSGCRSCSSSSSAPSAREERDFWVACTTIVVIGVVLDADAHRRSSPSGSRSPSSRWRVSRRTFRLVVGSALGVPERHGARRRAQAVAVATSPRTGRRRVNVTETAFETDLWTAQGLIGTEPGKGASSVVSVPGPPAARPQHGAEREHAPDAHAAHRLHRLGAHDVGSSARRSPAMYVADGRAVTDRRLALTLWAAFSSASGSSCR